MFSYLTHLECTVCGETFSADEPQGTCRSCGKALFARYDLEGIRTSVPRDEPAGRRPSMWRYSEVMPVRRQENVVSLGEGLTPLVRAGGLGTELGCRNLFVKDEGSNPTGTFKARGMSAAVSRARELGLKRLTLTRGGNASGALAAYCAQAGMEAHVFLPRVADAQTPAAYRWECEAYGANLTLVDGDMSDAVRVARERSADLGLFDVSTLREPYRLEGKKTMGYELAQQLGWRTPDVVLYPTGGGTGLVGIWKAFQEMKELGWIDRVTTRMIAVQPEGCAPIVRAFSQGADHATEWVDPRSIAAGIRVPSPFADYLILKVLVESGGTAVAVSDDEIVDSVHTMARTEGIFPCPEGAATLAGLRRLLREGTVDPSATIVLLNTGAAHKYLDVLE